MFNLKNFLIALVMFVAGSVFLSLSISLTPTPNTMPMDELGCRIIQYTCYIASVIILASGLASAADEVEWLFEGFPDEQSA